jgi:FtsH-binding integral membrane protein
MEEIQDRELNEQESLELISKMIRNTQKKIGKGGGTPFLIWGYTTICVTMLVWVLLFTTNNAQWHWLWFLILPVGSLLSRIYAKKKEQAPHVTTYVDRVIGYIWIVLGFTGAILSVLAFFLSIPILFTVTLIMGIGTALTGLVIQFRPLVISGALGMALSILVSLLSWKIQLPVFAFAFWVMMVVPGHYQNYKLKKTPCRKN